MTISFFSLLLMAFFCHVNFCQSRNKWLLVEMTLEKDWNDHQERSSADADVCSISTKRQCACYQISHSAPISRATISSSRLMKAISNGVGYHSHVCTASPWDTYTAWICLDVRGTKFCIRCKISPGKFWDTQILFVYKYISHELYVNFDDLMQCSSMLAR